MRSNKRLLGRVISIGQQFEEKKIKQKKKTKNKNKNKNKTTLSQRNFSDTFELL